MISEPTSHIELWAAHATEAVLALMLIGTFVAWIVMMVLHPRTRLEWAEFCKALCIVSILSRAFYTRFSGYQFTPIQDLVFWVLMIPPIAFFSINIIITWGLIAWDMCCGYRKDSKMHIGGGLLLAILIVIALIIIL